MKIDLPHLTADELAMYNDRGCPQCEQDVYIDKLAKRLNSALGVLADCVESLGYVNRFHPEITGCAVRYERIDKAQKIIAGGAQ